MFYGGEFPKMTETLKMLRRFQFTATIKSCTLMRSARFEILKWVT
jgi:hypothetical protein